MRTRKLAGISTAIAIVVATAVGCGAKHLGSHGAAPGSGSDEGDGSVGLLFTLPGGEHISTATYTLSNGGTVVRSATVNVASLPTLSIVIAGIPAASGYGVTVSATTDDGLVACSGAVGTVGADGGSTGPTFSVVDRVTTIVNVPLVCIDVPNQNQGGLLVNGIASCCATWDTILASPATLSTQAPNNTTTLTGHASGPCSGLSCVWSVLSGSGTLSGQTATTENGDGGAFAGYTYATFTCPSTATETDTLQFVCTDGPLPDGGFCPPASTIGTTTIKCQAPAVAYSVVRHGTINGVQQIDGIATPVFVENHALDMSTHADSLLSTIAMPTNAIGSQQPFTYQGIMAPSNASDGALSRSVDGHYLTLVGYGAMVGRSNIVLRNNPPYPRVVARIDASGNVDTSTYLPLPPADGGIGGAYQGAFIRSSATIDGTAFWVGGSDNSTGGAWYVPFGVAGGGTQINSSVTRIVGIFGGQLYGDTDPGAMPELFTVGSGVPTAPPGADVGVPGFPTTQTTTATVSAWAFAFAGASTLYVATDQSGTPPIGVQKWTLSGGTWSLQTTFNLAPGQSVAPPVAFNGLAVLATGGTITTLIASTVEPAGPTDMYVPANHLVVFVDNGGPYAGGASGMTDVGVIVAQAPAMTLYKGLALSPQ